MCFPAQVHLALTAVGTPFLPPHRAGARGEPKSTVNNSNLVETQKSASLSTISLRTMKQDCSVPGNPRSVTVLGDDPQRFLSEPQPGLRNVILLECHSHSHHLPRRTPSLKGPWSQPGGRGVWGSLWEQWGPSATMMGPW